MRKSQATDSSKPTPKQKPRFAAITGFEQRAGAAMFQASFDTVSGLASRKPLMLPPEEKCSPTARSTIMRMRVLVERLEHEPKLVALRHRDDVERRPVEDHLRALAALVDPDAKAIERREARIGEGRVHAAVSLDCSISYSPAMSLRRKSLPTGDFGIASTNT